MNLTSGGVAEVPEQPVREKPQRNQRILLAEDNLVNQEVALGMLEVMGYGVAVADNGSIALSMAGTTTYDLILMDCHMPEMDGFAAATAIRDMEQREGRDRVPIIALTADIQKGVRDRCTVSGMDSYLSKPFNQDQLRQKIGEWLGPDGAQLSAGEESAATGVPARPPSEAPPLLDGPSLAQLRDMGRKSGKDILGKVIDMYLQTTPADMRRMCDARRQHDADAIREIAHSLKSSSATLGARGFSERCAQIEGAAQSAAFAEVEALVDRLADELPAVLQALRDLKDAPKDRVPDAGGSDVAATVPSGPVILLVDDDANFRLSTAETLRAEGFVTREADSGSGALHACRQQAPDLVMLDGMMADMDGFEACRRLRMLEPMKNTPILMVTGLNDIDAVRKAFAAGATGFESKPLNALATIQRIRFQLRANHDARRLHETQQHLSTAQRMVRMGYWRWDSGSDALLISAQLSYMCGLGEETCHKTLADYLELVHPEDREHLRQHIRGVLGGSAETATEYRIQVSGGDTLIMHQETGALDGAPGAILGTVQDISRQREDEHRMRQLAFEDSLTGLASRAYFQRHLESQIKVFSRRQQRLALLYLDLDSFKDVNDSLVHKVGDDLLRVVANRVQGLLRGSDFAARLGGDEFCVLVDSWEDDIDLAEIAERCLHEINLPVEFGGKQQRPRVSIGIARYPDDGEDPNSLLKAADSAMYAAKQDGRHRFAFYRPELTVQAAQRLAIENELHDAIANDEFDLLYQPKVNLDSGRLDGVEALIRWQHPTRGLLSPGVFIDVAERIGIMNRLGDWVLKTACRQLAQWRAEGLPDFTMAVNISPSHFAEPTLVPLVQEALAAHGLEPKLLELEVTENVVQVSEQNREVFSRLVETGVSLAIDDFGTGYSSLSSLVHVPIDTLKIDRQFISTMLDNPDAAAMVGTIVGLAHAMAYSVVAEGVETLDQVHALAGIGCDVAQGFLFSQPVAPAAISTLARNDDLVRIAHGQDRSPDVVEQTA